MVILDFLKLMIAWAVKQDPTTSEDPLQHPDIRRMDARAKADLPMDSFGRASIANTADIVRDRDA